MAQCGYSDEEIMATGRLLNLKGKIIKQNISCNNFKVFKFDSLNIRSLEKPGFSDICESS